MQPIVIGPMSATGVISGVLNLIQMSTQLSEKSE